MNLKAEVILKTGADLGEGSIWNPQRQLLHWIDIEKSLLHSFDPDSGKDVSIALGAKPGTVVRRSDATGGGFVVGLAHRFAHVSDAGQIATLAAVNEPDTNRFNDGKCDPAGRFWCGSMAFDFSAGAGKLYMLDESHVVHTKLDSVSISNGIVWTSDGRTMYYIDTPSGKLDAFDFDIEFGAISNRRTAVKNIWGGYFDGMTIDRDDNVYIANWEGGCVLKIDPLMDKLLTKIEVPGAHNITSCAFGGSSFQDLYITTAKSDPKLHPSGGDLFRISLTDAQGSAAFEYAG